jgi:hypothetical protein
MESAQTKARAAIAILREGLRDFDLQRFAKASSQNGSLAIQSRNRALQHGRNLETHFHVIEDWEHGHQS